MSSSALSDTDRDDVFSVKKSVHTTMTSRVLDDHKRQQAANAGFYSNRILGSENLMGSKSSKLLQSMPAIKDNLLGNTQRTIERESPGISKFAYDQPARTFDHRPNYTNGTLPSQVDDQSDASIPMHAITSPKGGFSTDRGDFRYRKASAFDEMSRNMEAVSISNKSGRSKQSAPNNNQHMHELPSNDQQPSRTHHQPAFVSQPISSLINPN